MDLTPYEFPTCLYCGEIIKKHRKWCSTTCKKKYKEKIKEESKLTVQCRHCQKMFRTSLKNAAFCSRLCSKSHIRYIYKDIEAGLVTGLVGCIHELEVSIDLMRKGWEVYRALSPAAPSDLIITKGNQMLSVQVRKARFISESGKIECTNRRKVDQSHILALSIVAGKIVYIPDIDLIPD